jgi:anionic cell wall polymer biosynthesis LytR-Cps2A-Psr (LCP) family protein
VAALCSLLVLVGSGYAWASYRALTNKVTDLGTIASPDPSRPDVDGKAQNILVVGDDSRAGATPAELEALSTEASDGDNTDTMMLIHVPANGKAASVISFPRGSWVTVPGSSGDRSKLNGLYRPTRFLPDQPCHRWRGPVPERRSERKHRPRRFR